MPVPQRDLELTRKQLGEWFESRLPGASKIELSTLRGPSNTGFSSDTVMFDLSWEENGREQHEELVARIEPTGVRVFPHYDLDRQFRVMQGLADTDVPVPRMFGQEKGSQVLGVPFYLMQRVEGCIPPDSPTYHTEGWVAELEPAQRKSIWWSGLEVLARIHRLDWRGLGLEFLDDAPPNVSSIERQLADYERFLAWAAAEKRLPTCDEGLAWLKRNLPRQPEPVALCWGDSRLGNMIFHEDRCVAVLDWEMVTIGNPEQDFAWWLFFDRHHSEGIGVPRLPGFPKREESIARYQEWTGRTIHNLEYYEIFAAFRFSVIMVRVAQQLTIHGLLPEDSEFARDNPSTRLLGTLLEAAAAGSSA